MKSLSKRLVSVALIALMTLVIFSGCSDAAAPASEAATSAPAAPAADAPAAEGETEAPAADAPAAPAGEPTKLTVEVFDRALENGTNPADNFWTDWIKENALKDLNIEVEFMTVPRSEEVPQLNVLMAGGAPPDIVFTYNYAVVYNFYKQGGVADLAPFMGTSGAGLSAYLGADLLQMGQFDGAGQYIIPAKRIAINTYNTFMRGDWLEKVGMESPKTVDEFYNALVAFRDQNPGGVENIIPFSGSQGMIAFDSGPITDSFINFSELTDEDRFALAVGQDANATGMLYPGFKEGIRFLNKLYNEDLLDQEFALKPSRSEAELDMMSGTVGSYIANYDHPFRQQPGVFTNLVGIVPDASWVTVDMFPNQNDGSRTNQIYPPYGALNFVPASSQNVEGAVRYLDWLCKDEVRNWLVCGEEGVNHTLDENGIPVMIQLNNDPQMMNSPNNLDYAIIVNGVDLGDPEKNVLAISKSYEEQYVDDFMIAYDKSFEGMVYNPVPVPFDTEGQYVATLNEKRKEIMVRAISAPVADFDAIYDAGIEEWKSIGGQQCIDERRAYFQANPGYADYY